MDPGVQHARDGRRAASRRAPNGPELRRWRRKYPADYRAWITARSGGVAAVTKALPTGMMSGSSLALARRRRPLPSKSAGAATGDYFLRVYPSPALGDGRGANKPWLQELPDPVTKIAWQTVVEMHPETAAKLGIEEGELATVETKQGSVTAPVYLYIGIRPDTIAIAMGRGHTVVRPLCQRLSA